VAREVPVTFCDAEWSGPNVGRATVRGQDGKMLRSVR
jgi:hypothetical protein